MSRNPIVIKPEPKTVRVTCAKGHTWTAKRTTTLLGGASPDGSRRRIHSSTAEVTPGKCPTCGGPWRESLELVSE